MRLRNLALLATLVLAPACKGREGQWSGGAPKPVTAEPSSIRTTPSTPAKPATTPEADIAAAKASLLEEHGDAQRERIVRGVDQVASLWRTTDGDLVAFCKEQFVAEPAKVDALFDRLEAILEQVDGHFLELQRTVRWASEVETGDMLPIDDLFAGYDASAHITEDMFISKVAFAALLNFPLTTLEVRLRDGEKYTRRQWAEVRLTGRFDTRVPGDVAQAASAAEAAADQYIAGYNLWMHHVLAEDGKRMFPSKKRLISHWNLRDELKANYADADGLAKQRTIAKVMDRIVTQSIPAAVIDNPKLDWNPFTNAVTPAEAGTIEEDARADRPATASTEREPDTRFTHIRAHLVAARAIDPYSPIAPTLMERAFANAEVPEPRVRALLTAVLESPLTADAAKEIQAKLGRPLEPQDIWYEFGGGDVPEAELDAVTRKRYPTAAAFAADVPRILRDLGFTAEKAKFLSERIVVDPSRGAGHAMGAQRRTDQAHLRTRVEKDGMNYKGYNIAVHELGHNIEQTFSLYSIDHTLIEGVPNTAFTEALAFLFQARDLTLLGRPAPGGEAEKLRVLDAFWNTREIAGSALVEIDTWHWLYDHPDATPADIRDATVRIAREVWDRYYAPTLNGKGTSLLGIYSHTIASPLYLFNYVLGHMIAFQVEEHVAGKSAAIFATEFERMTRLGALSPDLWMTQATGKPVGAEPLLAATARALGQK